jgi:hypothetical protein
MEKICGDATVSTDNAAKSAGTDHFVFISAKQYTRLPSFVLKGYYAGKKKAETSIVESYGEAGYILRCGMIFSSSRAPFIGYPLQKISSLALAKAVRNWPLFELLLTSPVHADEVGAVVARAAAGELGPAHAPLEVDHILSLARGGE